MESPYIQAKTKQDSVVKEHGVRYALPLKLSYFDIVSWYSREYDSDMDSPCQLQNIQRNVNAINVPVDVGHIASNSFTVA